MDSGVHGLAAVAWSEAWNAAASEAGLRVPVDPARLLDMLRGMPVARALLSDLQRAVAAGRSVELLVSPDRRIAEIATGSAHYVLTALARDCVLAELIGRSHAAPMAARAPSAPARESAETSAAEGTPTRPAPAGILWEAPTAASRDGTPSEPIALPWLGPAAQLQVRREGAGRGAVCDDATSVYCADLRLQLPQLGRFEAHIRVCGGAVAVSIDCAKAADVEAELSTLQQRLLVCGLTSAHLSVAPGRSG
jgi:hypothetical protein